jgi:predicted RNase H-like HicB family nuclease
MLLYDLKITVEELKDGSDYHYLATSPELPNLIVVGDTPEEVLTLAPQVAAALITSMKAAGDPLPDTLRVIPSLPFQVQSVSLGPDDEPV